MNIVMITTGKRPQLSSQSVNSLMRNAADWSRHTLTVVIDSDGHPDYECLVSRYATTIINTTVQGASRSRNIGASSIPKYRRQSYVMFIDDDVYMCPKWDKAIGLACQPLPAAIISGHAHPYNHTVFGDAPNCTFTNVVSTVHMVMPWTLWDEVGYFTEPGGPGGSEDVDYCQRATGGGYPLVITKPHSVIHTGLTSSGGKPIVGADLVRQRNQEIERLYGIEGKVHYQ